MKSHASMNRIYRLVWNAALSLWVAVAENAKGRSKGGSARTIVDCSSVHQGDGGHGGDGGSGGFTLKTACRAALALLVSGALFASQAHAADAANAAVVVGAGSVQTAGNTTTIHQSSQNMAIDWTSLSTRANEALKFNQPNASAIALNRITGTSPSELLGSLTANGQVFILNPNGVLFGAGSQVNVGGLVASTMNLSNADFQAGNFKFTGSGSGSVVNQGTLTSAPGGYLALLAPEVRNEGVMVASLGTALLAAGNKVTLNLDNGSLLGYSIDQGAINALAENKQLIKADGGQVLLSARAMDSLTTATVNNTGVIEAKTIQNKAGRILLMGDMEYGTVNVAGTLDASAPDVGNGGFVETSAAHVKVAAGTKVTTLAANGKTGKWLIDPNDFTIAATDGDMDAATVAINLATTDFEIATATMGTAGGNGDINVNEALSWSSAQTLTLTAQGGIYINQAITASNGGLTLNATGSGYNGYINVPAAVNVGTFTLLNGMWRQLGSLPAFSATDFRISGGSFLRSLGGNGGSGTPYLIADIYGLQGIGSLTSNVGGSNVAYTQSFTLANNIDASGTANWNGGAGFKPISDYNTAYQGVANGQGYNISGLVINRPTTDFVGLFGALNQGQIKNLHLVGGSITGRDFAGALVGYSGGHSVIDNSSSTAAVTGNNQVGGLAGMNYGEVTNSHASGAVIGHNVVGGLVGDNRSAITGNYAAGDVTGNDYVGGLLGYSPGDANNSYASGDVTGNSSVGGLVGYGTGNITNSYASGDVVASSTVGGLVGWAFGNVSYSYSNGLVSGGSSTGGLVGVLDGGGTVSNSFWDTTTSGQATSAGGTGKTTTQLKQLATFAGWDIDDAGGTGKTWRIYDGHTGPLLRSFLTQLVLQPKYDGSGSALGNAGELAIPAGTDLSKISGVITGDDTLTLASNVLAGSYSASSSASIAGLYSGQQGYDISKVARTVASTGSAAGDVKIANGINYSSGTLLVNAAGAVSLNGINSASGSVAINAGGAVTNTGATSVAMFDLKAGNWQQLNGTLPTFSATDFRISGGSFLRALGGNGNNPIYGGTPYLIADVYGLQGIGSLITDFGGGYLAYTQSFTLANNIDATGTANWNGGAGFKPISDYATAYQGVANGQGYNISGLVINRPTTDFVGLFGALNQGTVKNLNLVGGSITGQNSVGALVGFSGDYSVIDNSSSTAAVTGNDQTGGLVGFNYGDVTNSGASGNVSGHNFVGGLVGDNRSAIAGSYAAGDVTGNDYVGGLLGYSPGDASNSYASGNVTGNSSVGGLTGLSFGNIANSYASGDVTASSMAGGLVGASFGNVSYSYSSGHVSGGSSTGGLVGANSGTVSDSYWDTTSSGQATSSGGIGKTTAEMKQLSTFAGWDIDDAGGTGKTWRIYDGHTGPLLRSFLTQLTLTPDYDGSGSLLANIASVGAAPNGTDTSKILGTESSLTLASNGAAGSYSATANGLYSTQDGYDINATRTITSAGSAIDEVKVANGINYSSGTLLVNAAGAVSLNGINSASGSVAINAGGAVTNTGATSVAMFDLKAGNWQQLNGTLPTFSATDFRISGGSFLRALGGNGNNPIYGGTPYLIADVYGLQGIGSLITDFGGGYLAYTQSFTLANNIDATGTANWNGGAGFKPISDYATAYQGVANGQGYNISGLVINRPTTDFVGLFGALNQGTVKNLNLVGGSITGQNSVGALVGFSGDYSVIDNSSSTAAVTGNDQTGGLVGFNYGDVTNSGASGNVSGHNFVGGLVGDNRSAIAGSYAAGDVTGNDYVGGLLGYSPGDASNSYASGNVTGNSSVGGLTGLSFGNIANSYASGDVTASSMAGGLVGASFGNVSYSYSSGHVSGGSSTGGLVGANSGTVSDSYWDTTSSGQATSSGGIGKTTAEMKQLSTFAGWDIDDAGGTGKTWRIYDGHTGPLLRSFLTATTLVDTTLTYDGTTQIGATVLGAGIFGSNASGRNAGSYQGSYYSDQTGYDISGGQLVIGKASLVLDAVADSKTYDGTTVSTGVVTKTGLFGTDDVTSLSQSFGSKNVLRTGGSALAVNAGYSVDDGNGGNNYNVTLTGATGTINKAALTVTANTVTRTYDGTTAATGAGTVGTLAGAAAGELVNAAGSQAFADKNAGTGKAVTASGVTIKDSGNADVTGNYDITYVANNISVINQANLTVSTSDVTRTYDGTTAAAGTAVATSGTVFSGDSMTGGSFAFANKNASTGDKVVNVSGVTVGDGANNANYNITYAANTSSTINQAALTVASSDVSKTYDGTTSASGTAVVTGGQLFGVDALSGGSFAFSDKNAGTDKTVNTSGVTAGEGLNNANYNITYAANSSSTINKAALTVTAGTITKTYDGTTAVAGAATVAALAGSGAGELVNSAGTQTFADKNAGSGKTVTASGVTIKDSGSADVTGNYDITYVANSTSVINQANLTVSTSDVTRTYDGTTAAAGTAISTSGTVFSGDSITGGSFAFANKNASTGDKVVNVSGVTVGDGANNANYNITYAANTSSTINQAALTVASSDVTKTYDGTTSASGTAVVTGGQLFGVDALSGGSFAFTNKNASIGDKVVNLSGVTVGDGTNNGNYNVTYAANTSSTINKAALTVTANTVTRTYDGTAAATGAGTVGTLAGASAGELVNAAGSQAFADKNAGNSKTVTASGVTIKDSGNADVTGNYDITYVANNTSVINQANLTVSTSDVIRTYDGTTAAAGTAITTSGTIFSGDSMTGGSFAFANKNASTGDKVVNVSGVTVGDGTNNANYNITYAANTTSTINKATLNLTATPDDKVYDGTTLATASYTDNRIAGDVLTYSATASFADRNVANGIVVTVGGITTSGTDAGNYTVGSTTVVGNTADITPKTLTVTAKDDSKLTGMPYSGGNGVSYSGIVAGETAAGVLTGSLSYGGDSQGANLPGEYDITPGGLTANSNYALNFVEGTLTLKAGDAASAALGKPELVSSYTATLSALASITAGGGDSSGGASVGGGGGGAVASNSPNAAGAALNAAASDSGSDGGNDK